MPPLAPPPMPVLIATSPAVLISPVIPARGDADALPWASKQSRRDLAAEPEAHAELDAALGERLRAGGVDVLLHAALDAGLDADAGLEADRDRVLARRRLVLADAAAEAQADAHVDRAAAAHRAEAGRVALRRSGRRRRTRRGCAAADPARRVRGQELRRHRGRRCAGRSGRSRSPGRRCRRRSRSAGRTPVPGSAITVPYASWRHRLARRCRRLSRRPSACRPRRSRRGSAHRRARARPRALPRRGAAA